MAAKSGRLTVAINLRRLLACLLLSEMAGVFAACCAVCRLGAYNGYAKPPFSLEPWAFMPAAILYFPTGIAAYAIDGSHSYLTKKALSGLAVSLVLSMIWAWIFFCAGNAEIAFAARVLGLAATIYASVRFHKIDPAAAILLTPQIVLECYLLVLNYRICIIN